MKRCKTCAARHQDEMGDYCEFLDKRLYLNDENTQAPCTE